MSFADEVKANGQLPGGRCAVGQMLATVDDDLRTEIVAVIESAAYSSSAIARALKARGHDITENSVGRHRREGCRCSQTM